MAKFVLRASREREVRGTAQRNKKREQRERKKKKKENRENTHTENREKERTKPKRQNNGARDAKAHGAGWARRRRLRPMLLASTTKSAHTGAGATPRNWLPAGTDGPSTEQR
jgi:hypothetical protein